jgi:hypothetical protein
MNLISAEKPTFTPTLRWTQKKETIDLVFEVYNAKEDLIEINENNINFHVISNGINYVMKFELYNNIDIEESSYIINEKFIKMSLRKLDNQKWNYLTKDKTLYKNNIKIDWNTWINDSDDEDNNGMDAINGNQQFDFNQMMQSMGGMGDMSKMAEMFGTGGMDNNNEEEENNDDEEKNNDDENFCEECSNN